jgi:phosphoribosylformylglycinamidine synthase
MGAAGLACSTCETASRGGTGIEIDLEKVPKRETGMTPYEIMLSESQERMLLIAQKGREREVEEIFEKWDLHGVTIGRVTGDGIMRLKAGKKIVAEIPAKALTDNAPVYHREARAIENSRFEISEAPDLLELLASPTIASKNWVYRQYDHMVQSRTIVGPGSDAAVIRIQEAGKFIAFTTDCNATYCRLDPFEGAKIAVAEAARNLVCSGARPLAVTDCLNFGNPMKPEVFWQFRRCVEGISEACRVFGTPVTGGNVSFYNESPAGAIDPTPVIGMLGLIDDPKHITTQWFKEAGDVIVLLGEIAGEPMKMDLAVAKEISDFTLEIIRQGWVKSAHDCSEGGLAVALAECCMNGVGATVDLPGSAAVLFGETQSRIIVTCAPRHAGKVGGTILGTTGGDRLRIKTSRGELCWDIARLRDVWWNSIARLMER